MSILEFFDKHWFLGFLAIILLGKCGLELIVLCKLPFRSFMVAKAGWPPIYLDADGDLHSPSNDAKEETQ